MSTAPSPARPEESVPTHPTVREAHLLVAADRDAHPVGIVSSLDVAAAVAEDSGGA